MRSGPQKLNGPGLKYELGVCIKTGRILWLNVPFKYGKGKCNNIKLNVSYSAFW